MSVPTQKIDPVALLQARVAFLEKKLANQQDLELTNERLQLELTASEAFNKELKNQMLKMTTELAVAIAVRDKAQEKVKQLQVENEELKRQNA